jgi:hypothetical protein
MHEGKQYIVAAVGSLGDAAECVALGCPNKKAPQALQ